MSKKKKSRGVKKYNAKAVSLRLIQESLWRIWVAGGHCLAEAQSGGVFNLRHLEGVLEHKQQWSFMALTFCVDEFGQAYVKTETRQFPEFVSRREIADICEPLIEKLGMDQNPNHWISNGYFMVPSLQVDLVDQLDEIVERFKIWGAFDRAIVELTSNRKLVG